MNKYVFDEQEATIWQVKTRSRGTNWRLPFVLVVILYLIPVRILVHAESFSTKYNFFQVKEVAPIFVRLHLVIFLFRGLFVRFLC